MKNTTRMGINNAARFITAIVKEEKETEGFGLFLQFMVLLSLAAQRFLQQVLHLSSHLLRSILLEPDPC